MVTDEERVSAKTKLRVAQAGLERGITDGELIDCLAEAVGFDSVSTERYEAGLLGRIADLIGGRSDLDAIMLPLDADGTPIRLGDEVYGKASIPLKVGEIRFRAYDEAVIVASAIEDGVRSTIAREGDFWRHEPDSWRLLEKDMYSLVMSEYAENPEADVRSLMQRAKKLAGVVSDES